MIIYINLGKISNIDFEVKNMKKFKNEIEITSFINEKLKSIETVRECRLYREEQYQITKEVVHVRNCSEWLIRINKIIKNIRFALENSYKFGKKWRRFADEDEINTMYSYYLEDAVYRDIILWDMLRQFLNEFYECEYKNSDSISIFTFFKNNHVKKKIGKDKCNRILNILNTKDHKYVRTGLRNSFTHSLDSTSSYIFHRYNSKGTLEANIENIIPKHPFDNITFVVNDIAIYLDILNEFVDELESFMNKNAILVYPRFTLNCKEIRDEDWWSIKILKEQYERIVIKCDTPCEYSFESEDCLACRPTLIKYWRINNEQGEALGTLKPKLSLEDMKKLYS